MARRGIMLLALACLGLGCFGGGDSASPCSDDGDCGDASSCIAGSCYADCAGGIGTGEATLVPVDDKPALSEVIDGNGTADQSLLADLDFDGKVTTFDLLPAQVAPTAPSVLIDTDGDGSPDFEVVDFDGDGFPDNRFFFDDRSVWVPDADSFDDYEPVGLGVARGTTPVSEDCAADGIETGPPDLGFDDYRPSSYCLRMVMDADGRTCLPR